MKWPTFPLSHLVRFVGGGTPSKADPAFWSGGIPWVSPKDMATRDIWDTQDHITEEAIAQSATQLVPASSILIVVRSGILVHSVPIGISRVLVSLNQDMKALLPLTESLDSEFLAYFLEARTAEILASCVKRGATVHSIDVNKLRQIQVPFPTFSEQRRIVEILDRADALRKKRAEADAKAKRILPALFIKIFGDPVTNPKGWNISRLDAVVEIGTQLVDPNQPVYVDLLHIGGEDIEKDTGRILNPKTVRESGLRGGKFYFARDHILYCKIRPYLNKVAFPQFEGVCSADIYPLLPDRQQIRPFFLVSLLRSDAFLAYARIHSERLRMPKLNKDQLGSCEIFLPPIKTQVIFEDLAQKFAAVDQRRYSARERLEEVFATLLHRAFSGDLTAKWREAHLKELLAEMEEQTKYLTAHRGNKQRDTVTLQDSLFE